MGEDSEVKASDMKKSVAQTVTMGEIAHDARPSSFLLGAVIIMGLLIVIGTAILLWVIVHRALHHNDVAAPQTKAAYHNVLATPSVLSLVPRPGERVQSITARSDGSLALDLRTVEGGERILIWAPEKAQIIAELELSKSVSQ
ncbi:flagellar basal body-associated FliL family protein [Aristophania vespae]|uniref:hypothetical protein n=1 Tax=Aristophania vespae TaxID=2697033 RepID=UPI0023516801|nr:hypothetical protein [Aristophania vespae]UMM64339.1 hypothetical protein DM15PD_13520 [Aristophania vespae]